MYNDEKSKFPNKIILFVTYIFSMTVFAVILSIILHFGFGLSESLSNALINFLVYTFLFITFLILMKKYYSKQLLHFQKNVAYFTALAIGGYIIGILLAGFLTVFLQQIIGFELRESVNQQQIEDSMKYWYLTLPMVVLYAPIVEETIFRGVIFNFAEDLKLPFKLNLILAFILSSSVFGLIHVVPAAITNNDPTELYLGISYITSGFVLTIIYFLTRNIFVSIFAHFIQNFISAVFIMLQIIFKDFFPTTETTADIIYIITKVLHLN